MSNLRWKTSVLADSPSDLGCKQAQGIDHAIDCRLEFKDFALDINFDLLAKIAFCNSCRDHGYSPYLQDRVVSIQSSPPASLDYGCEND